MGNKMLILFLPLLGCFVSLFGQESIIVGNGDLITNNQDPSPINIYFKSRRVQIVYKKVELNAAGFTEGYISKIGFFVVQAPTSRSLPNFSVRMKGTSSINAGQLDNEGLTDVFYSLEHTPVNNAFDEITLDKPYFWNGEENILIDVCFGILDNYFSEGTVKYDTATSGMYSIQNDNLNTCDQTSGTVFDIKPQLFLEIFEQKPNDIAVTSLISPVDFCSGNNEIQILLTNYGTNINTAVDVNWTFDGQLQQLITHSNSINNPSSGDNTAIVSLGTKNFEPRKRHEIVVWTSNPNNSVDGNTFNDTLQVTLAAGFEGTYTIGGTDPDYASISTAIEDLNAFGVCGDVTLNIRDAFYNEQFEINKIKGVSSSATVTIQSESQEAENVVISHSSGFDNNFVVRLNNSEWIVFKNLTIEATATFYSRVLELSGSPSNLQFEGNIFRGINSELIFSNLSTSFDNLRFFNNTFVSGSSGISLFSQATDLSRGLIISGNKFQNQSNNGLRLTYFEAPEITSNVFSSNTSSFYEGIVLSNCSANARVIGNQIFHIQSGRGIYASSLLGNEGNIAVIANNFVHMIGTNSIQGIYSEFGEYQLIAYNSVNILNTNEDSRAFQNHFGSNKTVINNIFSNEGGGYSAHLSGNEPFIQFDYNDLYTSGEFIGIYADEDLIDLPMWQSTTGLDSNSISEIPIFLADTSFRTVQIALNAKALPTNLVTTDLEGDSRSAISPDIGADEFDPPTIDAALIDLKPVTFPFDVGMQEIVVELKNFGVDNLQSVTIQWTLDGLIQNNVEWTGTLASSETEAISLGHVNFDLGVPRRIEAWSSNPNNIADVITVNDTVRIESLFAGLKGSYTIGGTDPDFQTINDAIVVLNGGGITGNTIFNIRPGTYPVKQVVSSIPGADSLKNVTIQSESNDSTDVILTSSNTTFNENYLFLLDGTQWLTFKHLTLQSINQSYNRIIELVDDCSNLKFESLVLRTNQTYGDLILSTSTSSQTGLSISSCLFDGGGMALNLQSSNNNRSEHIRITNNVFRNQVSYGIYLTNAISPEIKYNTIVSHPSFTYAYAIYTSPSFDETVIAANQINVLRSGNGIYLNNQVTSNDEMPSALIANNFIHIAGTNQNYGLWIVSQNTHNVFYNTINVTNTNFASRALYLSFTNNVHLRNNIFSNKGQGYAIYSDGPNSITSSDYNNFFVVSDKLAYLNGNDITTLQDWQLNTGHDLHSIVENPIFISDTSYRVTQISLNNAGIPVEEVMIDIEGEQRNVQFPDIGADEFDPPATDAGVIFVGTSRFPFEAGNQVIRARIKNFGADPLISAVVKWTIDDVEQTAVNWEGALLSNDTTTVTLGPIDFILGTGYDLVSWTESPNNMVDGVAANDTFKVPELFAGLGGTYTVGGDQSDFDFLADVINILNNGGIYDNVNINLRDGSYAEQLGLESYPGSDSTRLVTIQSESGDSSGVIVTHVGVWPSYHTIKLDGVEFISFKNLTIETSHPNNGYAVEMVDGCRNITFERVSFKAPPGGNHTLVYSHHIWPYKEDNSFITFINSTFLNGLYGMNINGFPRTPYSEEGFRCSYNVFSNQREEGIRINNVLYPEISFNEFRLNNDLYYSTPLSMTSISEGGSVHGNKIFDPNCDYGIYLSGCQGTSEKPFVVKNNFVVAGGSNNQTVSGITIFGGANQKILSNSVNVYSEKAESRALYFSGWNDNYILNNIFSNSGGGIAYHVQGEFGLSASDHNVFYSTGENLIAYSSNQNITALGDWTALTQLDSNSLVTDPLFEDNLADLHTNNVAIDKKGIPTAEVQFDIDGDTRDPVRPDIGADEFSTTANDASIVKLDNPQKPFAATLQPMLVTILNNGLDTLKEVTIEWEVNGERQLPFQYMRPLKSGESADSVNIGSYTFDQDVPYFIRVWSQNPNGMVDGDTVNDTVRVDSLYAALAGTYTLGGADADYENFADAIVSLARGGVVDEVIFEVQPGLYTEQVDIGKIEGASSERLVRFLSRSEVDTTVRIQYMPTGNNNYIIHLNGASFISFENLHFEVVPGDRGRIVLLDNGSHDNRFENNSFLGLEISQSSLDYAIIYSSNSNDNRNQFVGNNFRHGSFGIFMQGNSGDGEVGNVFEKNLFIGQSHRAIDAQYQDALNISMNEIHASLNISGFIGINLFGCGNDCMISGNNVYDISRGRGVYLSSCSAAMGNEIVILNNFIQVGSQDTEGFGLELNNSTNVNVFHNNINITGTNANSFALRSNFSNGVKVLNNIFVNSGGGRVYDKNGGTINISNFNDLYTVGDNFGTWEGTQVDDIIEWRSASNLDGNSISVDPLFAATNDLHVSEVDLNGTAFPLPTVITDIDGEMRNMTNPDIGADEFFPIVPNDAGIVEISQPNKNVPFPDGEVEIFGVIKNNGSDTINSVTIEWQINNNPQDAYDWSGSLIPGQRDTVLLGSFIFVVGVSHDIMAYTVNPDGMADGELSNDTLLVSGLYPALSGIYTIGGNLPDFNSLEEAATAINNGGILGPVTFNIRNGMYTGQISLSDIKGTSASDTIVIQSETQSAEDVTIHFVNQTRDHNYIIRLDETDYVTIRHLSISGGNRYYGTAIELINNSQHNSISHNVFTAENDVFDALVKSSSTSLDSHTEIIHNQFNQGGYGVLLHGQGRSLLESGNRIINNTFNNQFYGGVRAINQEGVLINANEIYTTSDYYSYFGIFCSYCQEDFAITKNKIAAERGHGIWLDRCDGSNNKGLVANNFVKVGSDQVSHGIYSYLGSNQNIYFNSINNTSSNQNSSAFGVYYGNDKNVINNILASPGGSFSYYSYSFTGVGNSDHNDLYSTGPFLGQWNGVNAASLTEWRQISQRDDNSLSVDPLFTSDTDLHCFQPLIDSMGVSVSQVSDDIDGDPRDIARPDIGADEFNYLIDDVGITRIINPVSGCDIGVQEVRVRIQNFSGLAIGGFDIGYTVDDGGPIIENIGNISIDPGASVDYVFGTTVDLSGIGDHTIAAFTSLSGDTHPENDTTLVTIENINKPEVVTNMIPADGTSGLSTSIAFSWQSNDESVLYDLFIWKDGEERPESPTVANITSINYLYVNPSLDFGALYRWQVISRNAFCETEGPEHTFRLLNLPDLTVANVQAPQTAFSGRVVEVSWEVSNTGDGETGMQQWTDVVYLSEDPLLDLNFDQYMTGVPNLSALAVGQSYTNNTKITLPNGLNGTYYIFIWTDRYNYLNETDNENNTARSNISTITLTPPPDLEVTSILAPSNVFSGSEIEIIWSVVNSGSGATRSAGWQDRVYLSPTQELDLGTALLLGQKNITQSLVPDSSFTANLTAKLPLDIFGEYFVIVETDVFNQEFEFASEDNNRTVSDAINITLKPTPDLLITNIQAPATSGNLAVITVSYTVYNQGEKAVGIWYDRLYLSSLSDSLNPNNAVLLSTDIRLAELDKDESYTQQKTVVIPGNISGDYYLFALTDYDDRLFEFNRNENNVSQAKKITVQTPDLTAEMLSTSATAMSGDSITVTWTLVNSGTAGINNRAIFQSVYVSTSSTADTSSAVRISMASQNVTLASGGQVDVSRRCQLPNGINGTYYVILAIDPKDNIFELDEANNIISGNAIDVELAPWVDLKPTFFLRPSSTTAGELIDVSYEVQNIGTKDALNETWVDKIFISAQSVFNISESEQLRFDQINKNLGVDSSYNENKQVSLPIDLITGNYYLHLFVDAEDDIYEHQSEGNNIFSTPAVLITGYPAIDLAVEGVQVLGQLESGKPTDVNWTVRNIDENPTISGGWVDAVYLSTDAIWDKDDEQLAARRFEGRLAENQSYTATISVTIPNGKQGAYYLLVVNDFSGINNDYNRSNNTGYERNEMGEPLPANISLTPSPDLIVSSLEAPISAFSGQPMTVSWRVKNIGEAATPTPQWTDRIYLSDNLTLDNSDRILATVARNAALQINEEYSVEREVLIPLGFTGNKIIIVKTDVNNVIYEHNREFNNVSSTNINLFQPPPADLRVISVTAPATALAGQNIQIEWTVRNEGENPAIGWMREAVYLSIDNKWDENDALVGSISNYINLPPAMTANHQIMGNLAGVPVGDYYVIVRTDILNNFGESNENNNETPADQVVSVDVPELIIGQLETNQLNNGDILYYRIEVPANLENESLLLTLRGDSLNGNNEIYLSFEKIPSGADFDFAFGESFAGNQEIIVPELAPGTYYLLVTGNTLMGNVQDVELYGQILNFEVRRVNADEGGNRGIVTVLIEGSKFDEGISFRLGKENIVIGSRAVYLVDRTKAYASFDLRGSPLGTYDVTAVKVSEETATLPDAFTIVSGDPPSLATNILRPSSTRPGRIITIQVEYENDGNVDIIKPVIQITSLAGAPIALDQEGLAKGQTILDLSLSELNGPPGILRPGALGSITVYAQATAQPAFIILIPDLELASLQNN